MTAEQIAQLAQVMREHGLTRLRVGEVELWQGAESPSDADAPSSAQLQPLQPQPDPRWMASGMKPPDLRALKLGGGSR